MLSREEYIAEREASMARQEARRAAEPSNPNPLRRRRFGTVDGLGRKPEDWFDDMYVPPMDVTEVMW